MKIETPQILWHNGADNDNGKNAPLYSLSLLSLSDKSHVLATAGNTSEVHLWNLHGFASSSNSENKRILQPSKNDLITHSLSLVRHDLSVNVVKFSPNGLHLATAGDGGSILLWSVAHKQEWAVLKKENDLQLKIVSACSQGICDLQWSADSNSIVVGTIDHAVMVYERNAAGNWNCAYRNNRDHASYVQGVAYDPHGLYVASMGSDRTVRIYQRKVKKAKKKKSKATAAALVQDNNNIVASTTNNNKPSFTDKLELTRTKTLKYRQVPTTTNTSLAESNNNTTSSKQYLFADESTVESFFRRLAWTQDGNFLVTPAALWHANTTGDNQAQPSFATYLFARHKFDVPYKVLFGLEKPSVAIRPNPVLFTLPNDNSENKENGMDYRSVFCVLTLDTVLIYDTHHTAPLCIARGLHYSSLTDATWSADGHHLLVSSTDGYISILSFAEGELGQVYVNPNAAATSAIVDEEQASKQETVATTTTVSAPRPTMTTLIPPCEPGQAATLVAPPAKKVKRVTPTLVSNPSSHKRVAEESCLVETAVTKLTIDEQQQPSKKKKRITPMLVSVAP